MRAGRLTPLVQDRGDDSAARTPGRHLDAGLETGAGGRPVYRVRWAAEDGRRIDYVVDAEIGAIIRADG